MIEFKKTNLNKLDEYLNLYNRSFKNFTKTRDYFKWLYVDNPLGNFVGIDCYDNMKLIGQVGGIPHEFVFNQNKVKFLISINVCVDPRYQGKWLFSKMLVQFEQIAKELNFDGIIGIANKSATPFWQRSIKLNKLKPLDVYIGFGKLETKKINKSNYNFYTFWSKKKLEWRIQNPMYKTFLNLDSNNQSVYSKTNFPFINAYSPLIFYEKNIDKNFLQKEPLKPIVYLGLIKDFKKTSFLYNLPEFLKPSPLNFVYKFFKSNYILDPNEIFFTFLDFDAF